MEQLDATRGWCCNGRTWTEHAGEDGKCCQPKGKTIEQLPKEAREEARDRMAKS